MIWLCWALSTLPVGWQDANLPPNDLVCFPTAEECLAAATVASITLGTSDTFNCTLYVLSVTQEDSNDDQR